MKKKLKILKGENDLIDKYEEIESVLNKENEVYGINKPMLNEKIALDTRTLNL